MIAPIKLSPGKQYGREKTYRKIETPYLNFNTKTSYQSKAQISANIAKLVIAKCAGKTRGDKKKIINLSLK